MKQYIGILGIIFIVFIVVFSLYEQIQKENKSAKSTRLSCQQEVTTFEKIYNDKKLKAIQKNILKENYTLSSYIKKTIYSKSKLFDYIDLKSMNKITIETLDSYKENVEQNDDVSKILYYIYENDINDPGKKTKNSKLYAGYVVFKFSNVKDELIYQVQIDFMDKRGLDLAKSIKCAIKSFMTIKGKK